MAVALAIQSQQEVSSLEEEAIPTDLVSHLNMVSFLLPKWSLRERVPGIQQYSINNVE